MIGHWGLAAGRSALSSNSDAGDGWELLQAGVVEGVGWMVWHLRRDLHNRHHLSEEPADPLSENPNAQRPWLKNTCWGRIEGLLHNRGTLVTQIISGQA